MMNEDADEDTISIISSKGYHRGDHHAILVTITAIITFHSKNLIFANKTATKQSCILKQKAHKALTAPASLLIARKMSHFTRGFDNSF